MSSNESNNGSILPTIMVVLAWMIAIILDKFVLPDVFLITGMQMTTIAIALSMVSVPVMMFSIAMFAYIASSNGDKRWGSTSLAAFVFFAPLGIFILTNLQFDIFLRFEEFVAAYLVAVFLGAIASGWFGNKLGKSKLTSQ